MVALSVSDNGTGDPAQLRRALRLSSAADLSGRHRGLANMMAMAEEPAGRCRPPLSSGGVFLRLDIPLSLSGSVPGGGAEGPRGRGPSPGESRRRQEGPW